MRLGALSVWVLRLQDGAAGAGIPRPMAPGRIAHARTPEPDDLA